jgi:transcriptional regulator with XRE-family HTH domain
MTAVPIVPADVVPVSRAARISEYATSLRRKREETGVVLADIARKSGYDIAELLRMESGSASLDSTTYSRVSSAISQLVRERTRR